jgi:hypothetical protein
MIEFYFAKNGIPLYGNLLQLPPEQLFHEKHANKLAHPADILSDKLGGLNKKLNAIVNHQGDEPVSDDKTTSISNYILELDSFYDSLFLIIKCLTKPEEIDNQDVTIWLKSINSQNYTNFVAATRQNHNLFRDMSNKIKHDHVGISILTVHNHKNIMVHGFYIRSITGENDQRGPDSKIHTPYKGYKSCKTAFSYNHFILNSVGCVFYYLHHLNKILFKTKPIGDYQENNVLDIITTCENIPHNFFPDEYSKPYAFVKRQDDNRILFKYPYRYKNNKKELFQEIYGVNGYLEFNQRTGSSHGIIPYLPLIKRQN